MFPTFKVIAGYKACILFDVATHPHDLVMAYGFVYLLQISYPQLLFFFFFLIMLYNCPTNNVIIKISLVFFFFYNN